ncbi:S4 domain-containing protein [uncultured Aquimonas sp.]|uniref:RNA-binding S4 domain-containing protein n=1 Tax=uncultured Aquimonas sp. TaxID=385483 RepID=UPI0008686A4F|nr:S4 domain-containing protein [uncultured Aquimonas sp.]ODU48148.1 MAG: RNA-binding protein [Xanthomonadaceae bacterium SCN 69-123]
MSGPGSTDTVGADSVRLDVWLWAARWFKTRALAKAQIEAHRIEVDGQPAKPSRGVRIGTRLTIERGGDRHDVEVTGLSDTRGPAPVAQALYLESEASKARRLELAAQRAAERAGYQPPETRPNKKARRLIRALGDIEML